MGRFGESAWANGEFSRDYLERADVHIVERRRMFGVVEYSSAISTGAG